MRARCLLWLLALSACAVPPPSAYVSRASAAGQPGGIALGRDTAGESCTQRQVGDASANVFCGTWRSPSARIWAGGPVSGTPLATLASTGAWRQPLDARYACAAPQSTTVLDNAPAELLVCTDRRSGGPHAALVTALDGRVWYADGEQFALAVMQRGLGVLSGRLPAAAAGGARETSGADRLLANALAASSAGANDIGAYEDALRAGFKANLDEDFAAAEQDFRTALQVQQKKLGYDGPATARPTALLALQISNQGRYTEADGLLARAKDLAARADDPLLGPELLGIEALHAKNQEQHEQALALLRRAEAGYAALLPREVLEAQSRPPRPQLVGAPLGGRTGAIGDLLPSRDLVTDPAALAALLGLVETRRYEAIELRLLGRAAEADAAIEAAQNLATANELRVPALSARLERTAGQDRAIAGDPAEAAGSFAAAGRDYGVAVPGGRPVAETILLHAGTLARLHQDQQALAACDEGATLLRTLGSGTRAELLEPCLDVLGAQAHQLGEGTPGEQAMLSHAFELAQLSQGTLTTQQIDEVTVRLAASARDPKVGEAIRQKQQSLARLEQLLAERDTARSEQASAASDSTTATPAYSEAQLAEMDRQVAEARTAADEADAALQAVAPNYGQLIQAVVPAADVLKALHPGEAFVAIDLSSAGGWTFLLGDGRIAAARIGADLASITAAVAHLRTSVTPDDNGTLPAFDIAAARALYTATLGPVAPRLAGVSSLVVAPTGPLLSIPFGVLLTGPATSDQLAKAPWLLRQAAIAHVPAAANFVRMRGLAAHATPGRPWFGFGEFQPMTLAQAQHSFPASRCADSAEAIAGLPPLQRSGFELEKTRDVLGAAAGDALLGAAFTAPAVLRADLSDVRVLHFATHALLPTDLRCQGEPAIVTSAPAGATDASGALLTASEVLGKMHLDADAVILSACNSGGAGGVSGTAGQSLSGLARAFFFAGARALLVTHWEANDASSAFIVIETMRRAREPGTGFAAALRAAQLYLIDRAATTPGAVSAHPFYWGAFALIGEGGGGTRPVAGL